jgi:predicted phage tail protein
VTLRILGWFFVPLGGLVLMATFWTLENVRATVVNVCSGLVLVVIGIAMIYVARRIVVRHGRNAVSADPDSGKSNVHD